MNDQSTTYPELPRSDYLDNTLRRARSAAEQRSHRYVTLEHFLFALLDDPDAITLMNGIGADRTVIRGQITDAVNNRMASLVVPDGRTPNFSYKFDSVFYMASQDAVRLGRNSIDGAIALIALARDADSNASAILAANGFNAAAALQHLSSIGEVQARPVQPHRQSPQPRFSVEGQQGPQQGSVQPTRPPAEVRSMSESRPTIASPGARMTSGEVSMEDMLASVREILEAEERKERGPHTEPAERQPSLSDRGPQWQNPHLRAVPPQDQPREVRQQPGGINHRIEPRLGEPALPQNRQHSRTPPSFEERAREQPPAVNVPPTLSPPQRRRAGRVETSSVITNALRDIPRRVRVAVPRTIQIKISKEEAGVVFGNPSVRGTGLPAACRAVTVRVSAPEGGFFIEASSPETQWLFDRPSFLGEETFGTWTWTLIPSDSGSYVLTFAISARDVDQNGLSGDLAVPLQEIKIRVRGNFWRGLARFLTTMMLISAGSGLTVGAYYILKMMGKLPH